MVDPVSPAGASLGDIAAVETGSAAPIDGSRGVDAASFAPESSAADAVSRIAIDLSEGRISRDEAVQKLVAEALDSEMVRAAPENLRAEMAAALEALIATDPHLLSLVNGLGGATRSGDAG